MISRHRLLGAIKILNHGCLGRTNTLRITAGALTLDNTAMALLAAAGEWTVVDAGKMSELFVLAVERI